MGEPASEATFGDRLLEACERYGPLCAGSDPSAALLGAWGLADTAHGVDEFAQRCVEAFAGHVAIVKPQVAFFERHGSAGMAVLESLVATARSAGLLVLCDAKRGDIDSTCEAYADAWLSPRSALAGDAVTASAYLGFDALAPMFDAAEEHGRAVFVVARSSNPEGRPIQSARSASGSTVDDDLLASVARRNATWLAAVGGAHSIGATGAVIGATLEPSEFDVRGLGGPILAPGLGAQGAGPAQIAERFAGCLPGSVVPSASRSVLVNGPSREGLRAEAARLNESLARALV